MPGTFRIAPAEEVPEGADVCHIDELAEPAKERLPAVAGRTGTTTDDPAFESTVERCDVVKYTDYYVIERFDPAAGR